MIKPNLENNVLGHRHVAYQVIIHKLLVGQRGLGLRVKSEKKNTSKNTFHNSLKYFCCHQCHSLPIQQYATQQTRKRQLTIKLLSRISESAPFMETCGKFSCGKFWFSGLSKTSRPVYFKVSISWTRVFCL